MRNCKDETTKRVRFPVCRKKQPKANCCVHRRLWILCISCWCILSDRNSNRGPQWQCHKTMYIRGPATLRLFVLYVLICKRAEVVYSRCRDVQKNTRLWFLFLYKLLCNNNEWYSYRLNRNESLRCDDITFGSCRELPFPAGGRWSSDEWTLVCGNIVPVFKYWDLLLEWIYL